MQEIVGDLFASVKADAICITTNGFVNSQCANTMGRGCAREAAKRWSGIEKLLGRRIKAQGSHVYRLTQNLPDSSYNVLEIGLRSALELSNLRTDFLPYHLVSFPTKPAHCPHGDLLPHYRERQPATSTQKTYPGWMAKSKLTLIEQSARELAWLANEYKWENIVLPRPGCGAGELNWDEVRPILSNVLDDRFYAITFA